MANKLFIILAASLLFASNPALARPRENDNVRRGLKSAEDIIKTNLILKSMRTSEKSTPVQTKMPATTVGYHTGGTVYNSFIRYPDKKTAVRLITRCRNAFANLGLDITSSSVDRCDGVPDKWCFSIVVESAGVYITTYKSVYTYSLVKALEKLMGSIIDCTNAGWRILESDVFHINDAYYFKMTLVSVETDSLPSLEQD